MGWAYSLRGKPCFLQILRFHFSLVRRLSRGRAVLLKPAAPQPDMTRHSRCRKKQREQRSKQGKH